MTFVDALGLVRLVMRFALPELKGLLVFLDASQEAAARIEFDRIISQKRAEAAGRAANASSDSTSKAREQAAGASARAASKATEARHGQR